MASILSTTPVSSQGWPRETHLRVLLFASLRDAAAWSERLVPLPSSEPTPSTPLKLWHQLGLASVWPPTIPPSPPGSLPQGLRVAINQRFAAPDTPLKPGDELAFLPPITGG
ncbi:MAG: MoaD/ThiS family protein [Cyanobacteriota bacterium]|jgi:molybdopterin synthase sulfur carrier subunit